MRIYHGTLQDLDELAEIEKASYPEAEAASRESIEKRLKAFGDCFWILEEDGEIRAFINGMVSDQPDLVDEMYDHSEWHDEKGDWQMIFSVVTSPKYRKRGYASIVMKQVIEDARKRNRKGIVLTCKERLIPFYERFGYVNEGESVSNHGGAIWYQMRLTF